MSMIIGAGFSGLIAAHIFPGIDIIDAAPGPAQLHNALLRFRSDSVGAVTGVTFRPVTVRKGVWHNGAFASPTISLANAYSIKVLGSVLGDRSIWNIEPVTRWIAPPDFYDRLIDSVGHRIRWATPFQASDLLRDGPIISTMPMDKMVFDNAPVTLRDGQLPEFRRAGITVATFEVDRCHAHQTVYYPSGRHGVYRASITDDRLIVEAVGDDIEAGMDDVLDSFWLVRGQLNQIKAAKQSYGKIAPIDEKVRKQYIQTLTEVYNIYSLGRFAIWKNILLDDVVQDAQVIKRLISTTAYDRKLHHHKTRN